MATGGGNGETSIDIAALSERLETINRVVRQAQAQKTGQTSTKTAAQKTPAVAVAESKSDKSDSADANTIAAAISKEDTSASASDATESKAPAIDELTLDDENDDENRNKR